MLKKNSVAGSLESNDVMVELFLNDNGRIIELNSPVKAQFGDQMLKVVEDVLNKHQLDNVKVVLSDKGALDYTIAARLETAILRGMQSE